MSRLDDALREELSALLDDALPEARAAELRRRLEEDAELRREFEELKRTVAVVRALPKARAPDELRARIRAALAPSSRPVRRWRWLAAAATLALAVTVAYFATRDPAASRFETARHEEQPAPSEPERAAEPGAARPEEPSVVRSLKKERTEEAKARVETPAMEEARVEAPPEAEEADAAKPAPAERDALGRRARAKDDVRLDDEEGGLLARLERGAGLAAAERLAYIRELEGLEQERFAQHLGSLRGEGARLAVVAGGTADVTLHDLAEFEGVRALLESRFARAKAGEEKRASGRGAKVAFRSRYTPHQQELHLDVPAGEVEPLLTLLARLDADDARRQEREKARKGPTIGVVTAPPGKKNAETKTRRVVVRLRYVPPPPPPPTAPAGDKR